MSKGWLGIGIAVACMVPGLVVRVGAVTVSAPAEAALYGGAVVASAFLLSWMAEVAQLDISQGFALALLALIAVLPEYVVDASFAWLGGKDPAYTHYAVANMTGANRLLIGIAWPMVLIIGLLRFKKREVELVQTHLVAVAVLLLATLYVFILPLKGSLGLLDFVVLVLLFIFYMVRVARMPSEEPHLVGPAALIGSMSTGRRRLVTAALALLATGVVLVVAEPFARALVDTGVEMGIDEFLLVQWLAPVASEAPEFVVVGIFAWRAMATEAFGTLVSSKINQWTLLVGMLPVIYMISLGAAEPLPLDSRQSWEIALTAGQSLFAVSLVLDRRLSVQGALILLVLFLVQFLFQETRHVVTVIYLVLAALVFIRDRDHVVPVFQSLWKR